MSDKENNLLEWYQNYDNNPGKIVIVQKEREGMQSPTQADLNPVPADSPQDQIQKEILQQAKEPELTMKSDPVIAKDKMNAYEAYGLSEVIKRKLEYYSHLSGSESVDMIRKEGVATEVKNLVNQLANIVGNL